MRHRIWLSILFVGSLVPAGCASPAPPVAEGSPSPASINPSSASPAPPSEIAHGSPSPPPRKNGLVRVTLGASSYQAGSVLAVTIANGLVKSIYTDDFKTECTIVILQRNDSGSWTDITGCRLGRPTLTVVIGPGASRTVSLDPHSFHLTGGGTGLGFGSGTYRIKFTYRDQPEMGGEDPSVVYSAEVRVS